MQSPVFLDSLGIRVSIFRFLGLEFTGLINFLCF